MPKSKASYTELTVSGDWSTNERGFEVELRVEISYTQILARTLIEYKWHLLLAVLSQSLMYVTLVNARLRWPDSQVCKNLDNYKRTMGICTVYIKSYRYVFGSNLNQPALMTLFVFCATEVIF